MHCLNLPEGVSKELTKEVTFAQSLKGLGVSQVKSRWGGGSISIREKMYAQYMHTMKKLYAHQNVRDSMRQA